MKKLLIAGGKFSDIPTIKSAQKLGYYVITSGNNQFDLGHLYSDETFLEDYSNKKSMLQLAKKLKISALVPSCDDVSAMTCSYISQHLNIGKFDNLKTSETIHHKDLYRKFALQNKIDTPFGLGFTSVRTALNGIKKYFKDKKIIIKPVDMASGKGISVAHNEIEAIQAIYKAFEISKKRRIIIEEFIDGSRHGFSTILLKQKVIFCFYDNEQYQHNPYAVSGTTTSGSITTYMMKKLINDIEKIAKILNLNDGIFHTQTIAKSSLNGKKELIIIEACRRGGGDLYTQFVSMANNIDYPSIFIQAFNGLEIKPFYQKQRKFFARQCVMSKKTGILENIIFEDEIKKNIIDSFMWHQKGEVISNTTTYKAGIIFLEFDSKKSMEEKINNLHHFTTFNLIPRNSRGGGAVTSYLLLHILISSVYFVYFISSFIKQTFFIQTSMYVIFSQAKRSIK